MNAPKFSLEFPTFGIENMPTLPASWQDVSWHNETCPRFSTGTGLIVFVDFADPSDRELGGSRFSVHLDSDDLEVLHEGNDWAAVLAFVESFTTKLPADLIAPVHSLDDAKGWIERLHRHGLSFHFDDSPDTIVKGVAGEAVFDENGAKIVTARVAQLYAQTWPGEIECPIGYLLNVMDGVDA